MIAWLNHLSWLVWALMALACWFVACAIFLWALWGPEIRADDQGRDAEIIAFPAHDLEWGDAA